MRRQLRTRTQSAGLAVAVACAARPTLADTQSTNSPTTTVEETERHKWSFSAVASTYFVPDAHDYVQPTLSADYRWLHLEARYNYEALDTASMWVGYNFSGGEALTWEFTPRLGGVFGDTRGVAPGYRGSMEWWKLHLYSEGEYLFNSAGSDESYFYNWSELSLAPVDWFRFGFVTERTRAYKSSVDIQRGFLVGFSYWKVDVTTYVLNLDESKPTVVLATGLHF